MENSQSLAERLGRLERQNKLYKWVFLAILIVSTVSWFPGFLRIQEPQANAAASAGGRVVDAEAFRVVDSDGKVRAVLGCTDGIPILVLIDAEGKQRASQSMDGCLLVDSKGMPRVRLGLDPKGVMAGLTISDEVGKIRMDLSYANLGNEGTTYGLSLKGANGKETATLDTFTKGGRYTSSFELYDANGQCRTSVCSGGTNGFLAYDAGGKGIWKAP